MGLPNIGPLELIIILAIALLIVGPGRLPEMGNGHRADYPRVPQGLDSDITDAATVDYRVERLHAAAAEHARRLRRPRTAPPRPPRTRLSTACRTAAATTTAPRPREPSGAEAAGSGAPVTCRPVPLSPPPASGAKTDGTNDA